ncbi:hypothetical protein [Streptomyces xanthii]|uniref:Uncharacterized protein n=1 Tax=Streptomyces xanthii TaxID=2768069 RepID=A0A7H1BBJ2_9ACTN|nr:hypothetical protein [Streptomyces xanthii]QNS06097.1 hypothetical protein IAG42_22640 [Streptomyces xanthii]
MPGPTTRARWAVFSCVLVPLALIGYGGRHAGAAGAALGLTAVTAACRVLLGRTERRVAESGAAQLHSEQHCSLRHPSRRPGAGARGGAPRAGRCTPGD